MSQHGDNDDMDQVDEVEDSSPPSPPPSNHHPNVDVGIGLGPGAGDFVPLVPGPLVANLLSRAQAGVLRQDQLQLLQQALVSVQGLPPG